jgi:hypothetical protein
MNITQAELDALRSTKNESEWNNVCNGIKQARNGSYPPDWWAMVMLSGLAKEVANAWGDPDAFEIKIEVIK